MGGLAIAAVTLRLWAKGIRKLKIGADDILIVGGLVNTTLLTRLEVRLSLTFARFWRSHCAFVTLSAQRDFGSGITSFTSSLAL